MLVQLMIEQMVHLMDYIKLLSVPSTKSVTYTHVAQGQTSGSTAGIYTGL